MTELERRTALLLLAGGALGAGTACAQGANETPKKNEGEAALCPDVVGKLLRVAKPGQPMTMDYRADRVTIEVDDKNRIVALRIG